MSETENKGSNQKAPAAVVSVGSSTRPWQFVRITWRWLGVALSLLTYGFASFIQHELEPFFSVWQIAWVTLPLTISIAGAIILTVLDKPGWALLITFVAPFASFLAGTTAGKQVHAYLDYTRYHYTTLGCTHSDIKSIPDWCWRMLTGKDHPHQSFPVIQDFLAYLHLYGWIGCTKAILIGIFLGYAILTTIAWPITKRHL